LIIEITRSNTFFKSCW